VDSKINPNRKKFGTEQSNSGRISRTAWQLSSQPALTLTRIVVRH
jgi:hypothetical protein